MIFQYLMTGILIGIIFGIPLGSVGALCIQETIHHGISAGLISGLASSIADVLYACVGAFSLTFISDFILEFQVPIHLTGALLLMIMAMKLLYKQTNTKIEKGKDRKGYLKIFISSFAVAITNPAAIISFLFAFSVFGIYGTQGLMNGFLLIIGVFIGTFIWWLILVLLSNFMKQKLKSKWYRKANVVLGTILIIFSISIIMKTLQF